MKLQFWRKPSAPAQEHERSVAELTTALEAAQVELQAATDSFDAEPTSTAERTVLGARETIGKLNLHLERAQRLHVAAKTREAEADRVQKLARLAEIEGSLSEASLTAVRAPLLDRELDLLAAWAQLRVEKVAAGATLNSLSSEQLKLRTELGLVSENERWSLPSTHIHVTAKHHLVDALEALTNETTEPALQRELVHITSTIRDSR